MNSKQRERWEKIRAKGKLRFILIHGVLGWGVPFAILASIFKAILRNIFPLKNFISFGFLIDLLIDFLSMALVGGCVYGYIMWCYTEKLYLKR